MRLPHLRSELSLLVLYLCMSVLAVPGYNMGVRIFLSNGSGNKEVNMMVKIVKLIPGADREQPAEDQDGLD